MNLTRRLSAAKDAFNENDVAASRAAHESKANASTVTPRARNSTPGNNDDNTNDGEIKYDAEEAHGKDDMHAKDEPNGRAGEEQELLSETECRDSLSSAVRLLSQTLFFVIFCVKHITNGRRNATYVSFHYFKMNPP